MSNIIRIGLSLLIAAVVFGAQAHDLRRLSGGVGAENICQDVYPGKSLEETNGDYRSKYHTIAHQILDSESDLGVVTPSMYAIIDNIIDESRSKLDKISVDADLDRNLQFARDAFQKIDCILLHNNFVYPGHGLVNLLSDGLEETTYHGLDRDELRSQVHNIRRRKFIDANESGKFHVVDCDVASYIYLAVGEVLGFPIRLVEIPQHNFVRWDLGTAYVDFETMDGAVVDDDYYVKKWRIDPKFIGRSGILSSMNSRQVLAYHWNSIAIAWSWQGNIPAMLNSYMRSLSIDATHAFAANNLGWFYAATPKPEWRDAAQAIQYALQAVQIIDDGDSLDTLACAYAQAGKFQDAITTEFRALQAGYSPFNSNIQGNIELFQSNPPQTCTDVSFGKDPRPFRPTQIFVPAATDKDLTRLH